VGKKKGREEGILLGFSGGIALGARLGRLKEMLVLIFLSIILSGYSNPKI